MEYCSIQSAKIIDRPQYNFLKPDRLSGRNDVTSSKMNFRPDIRQNLFSQKSGYLEFV